jgi:glycosyltransferase involved in cell wall biosynthesis
MGLHLAIDAIGVKHSGGATVLLDVLSAAINDTRFREVSVFCSPRADRRFDISIGSKIREIECGLAEKNRLYRLWWLENRLPSEVRRCGANVLLCMGGIGSAGGQLPHVTFIQQSLPFFSKVLAGIGPFERLRMNVILRAMNKSCQSSWQVIVQTPTMLRRIAETFRIPPTRITVVLPVVNDLPKPVTLSDRLAVMRDAKAGLRLLYVGNQSSYKNVNFLVSAMSSLRVLLPDLRLFLTWPPDHPARRAEGVVGLGYLHGAELREAYELATALIMPSFVETVGLPMLEAMNVGTPVLAANRPYAHDVSEDAALFFDPVDVSDLTSKVSALLSDKCVRENLVRKGRDLLRRRQSERPYTRMLDIVAAAASSSIQAEVRS